jgi:glycosyltransferase involved in cell wall biosynthesis
MKWFYKYRYNIYCTGRTWRAVSDEKLPYYYGAADVVFIQRVKILNSGNALMPMLFGKIVVGPDCGNVGPLLKQWGYPVFSISDTSNLADYVRESLRMERNGIGRMNKKRQFVEYSTAIISGKLYEEYIRLL